MKKIWIRLFVRVAAVFAAFVVLLAVVNGSFLGSYYVWREKHILLDTADQIRQLDLTDTEATLEALNRLNADQNFLIDIFSQDGQTLYTTFGQQIWGSSDFSTYLPGFYRREMTALEQEQRADGSWFITAVDNKNNANTSSIKAACPTTATWRSGCRKACWRPAPRRPANLS